MRLLGTIALTCVLMLMPVATAGADPDTGSRPRLGLRA
jgi:hypothetical protein